MKKLLILAIILAPAVVLAQETATVNVSTSIRAAFELEKVDDLLFGNVQAGDAVSILATNGTLSNTGSTAKRAKITSTATTATVYTFSGLSYSSGTITVPRTTGTEGAADISITLSFAVGDASGVGTSYTPGLTTAAANATGNTLWIGGSFTAPSATSIGNVYSGALTVSAVYL